MKVSLCSIAFRRESTNLPAIIAIASELGYEGLEIWGNHLSLSEAYLDAICGLLREKSLRVPMVSPYFDLTSGDHELKRSLANARRYADACLRLRAPLMRVFTGVKGSGDISLDEYRKATESIKEMSRIAQERGVTLALETHPRTLVDSVPACERLLDAVDDDNVKLNLDIYHMWEAHGDPLDSYRRLAPAVAHIHAKNAAIGPVSPDHYPLLHDRQASQDIVGVTYLADGDMPYGEFLDELRRTKFAGFVSIEWFGPDPLAAAKHELDFVKATLEVNSA